MSRISAGLFGFSWLMCAATASAQELYLAPKSASQPAANLGKPVPAATLGRPLPLVIPAAGGPAAVEPAGFQNATIVPPLRPLIAPALPVRDTGPPMLAPVPMPIINGSDGSTPPGSAIVIPTPAPTPLATDGPTLQATPLPPPTALVTPSPGCPTCAGNGLDAAAPESPNGGYATGVAMAPATTAFGNGSVDPAGPPMTRFYGSAEFLLWFMSNANSPPLLATAPTRPTNAVPIPPGTTFLFDGSSLYPEIRYGGRATVGFWLDPCATRAIEVSAFALAPSFLNQGFDAANFGGVLFRPFHAVNSGAANGGEFAENVNAIGGAGRVDITGSSFMWGAEADYRRRLCCSCMGRIDLLAGFRYLNLNEDLQIQETFGTAQAPPGPGNTFIGTVTDRFSTSNSFYGGQLGIHYEHRWDRWTVDATAKVALGYTASVVTIFGQQNVTAPPLGTFNGGLLALGTNSGTFSTSNFSVVPEVDLNVGWYLTPRLKLFVGYTSLFWTSVLRPGDQIDRNLDVTRIPNFNATQVGGAAFVPTNAPNPVVPFKRTDLWVQGINVGFQFKW